MVRTPAYPGESAYMLGYWLMEVQCRVELSWYQDISGTWPDYFAHLMADAKDAIRELVTVGLAPSQAFPAGDLPLKI